MLEKVFKNHRIRCICLSVSHTKDALEGFPKLWVKDCIYDRIEARVDIAQKGGDVKGNVARGGVDVVFYTEGVEDVTGEEGGPANKETGCKNIN